MRTVNPRLPRRWDQAPPREAEKGTTKPAELGKSPATRNRYQVYLSRLFQRAGEHGYVEGNPAARIKRLREEERAVPALEVATQDTLIEACDDKIKDYVMIPLEPGCHQGEVLRLVRYARHCPEDAAARARTLLGGRLAAGE